MIFFQLPSTLLPQLRDPKIYKAFQSTAVQLGKTCLLHSPKEHFCFTHFPFWTASLNSCSLYSQLLFLTLTPQGRRGSLMVLGGNQEGPRSGRPLEQGHSGDQSHVCAFHACFSLLPSVHPNARKERGTNLFLKPRRLHRVPVSSSKESWTKMETTVSFRIDFLEAWE